MFIKINNTNTDFSVYFTIQVIFVITGKLILVFFLQVML